MALWKTKDRRQVSGIPGIRYFAVAVGGLIKKYISNERDLLSRGWRVALQFQPKS
jgi:hypothetical protein